jgi:diguanylate cyclase (GGDEF)-like protein
MQRVALASNYRFVYVVLSCAVGLLTLGSTFLTSLYDTSAAVVLAATALVMWSLMLLFLSKLTNLSASRIITAALIAITTGTVLASAHSGHQGAAGVIAITCASAMVALSAMQEERNIAWISSAVVIVVDAIGVIIMNNSFQGALASCGALGVLVIEFFLVRQTHAPIVQALNDALERADIFSTITRSSREFHSREPEEAIRNIVNVTKTLGYISVSVVSFDRRQKIFEDGVPIPNVMDIAVRASATRRVTITEDEQAGKNSRTRQGDIVGVPIWINGRYSAALIVQTSPFIKVSQRDCEALELLADQAGRALENAGKAAMDRRVVERLTDESQRDKLTGLGNRRFADQMVANLKVGDVLAMIDLDGLKSTNDVFGHAAGDELLHEVGVFLADQIRNPDTASRLGGDEFMIVLHSAGEGAPAILERLLAMWREKKIYDTTFSIGMAVHRHDVSPRETVEAADEALYRAKKAGKNRLVQAAAA